MKIVFFIETFLMTLKSFFRILFTNIKRSKLKNVKRIEDTCYVFANGPSLKKDIEPHLDFFQNKDVVVLNHFVMSDYFTKIKPRYYFCIDPIFLKDTPEENITDTLTNIKNKVNWKMYLLIPNIPHVVKRFIAFYKENVHIEIIPISTITIEGFRCFTHFCYSNNLGMPSPQTVANAAIFIPVNLGYKKIFVWGIDHTWHKNIHVDENNELFIVFDRFYENGEQPKTPIKHSVTSRPLLAHEPFISLARALQSHHLINKYAQKNDCKIYNASSVSLVDAYERTKNIF